MRGFASPLVAGLVLAVGCSARPERGTTPVTDNEAEAALLERATEELPCARSETRVGRLSDQEYLAWGCDREARYRIHCNGIGGCLALQDGEREIATSDASVDLRCKKALLNVRHVDNGHFVAEGCGRTAEYHTRCSSVPQGCARRGKSPLECGQHCTTMIASP